MHVHGAAWNRTLSYCIRLFPIHLTIITEDAAVFIGFPLSDHACQDPPDLPTRPLSTQPLTTLVLCRSS